MRRRGFLSAIVAAIVARFVPTAEAENVLIGGSYMPTPVIGVDIGGNSECGWHRLSVDLKTGAQETYFSTDAPDTPMNEIVWQRKD